MRAKKQNTEIRKKQIAESTLKLLGQKSFAELGISDIAKEVGIVPSGIYSHYSGKEDILAIILDLVQAKLMEILRLANDQSGNSIVHLKTLIISHAKMLSENPGIPEVVFTQGIFSQQEFYREKSQKIMHQYISEVEKVIEKGQEEGIIRDDNQSSVISRMFFGLVLPSAMSLGKNRDNSKIVQHVKEAWPIFEDGISKSKKSK